MISVICKYQFSNLLFFCEKNIHLAQRQLTLASISSFNRVYFQETKVGSLKVKVKVEVKTCISFHQREGCSLQNIKVIEGIGMCILLWKLFIWNNLNLFQLWIDVINLFNELFCFYLDLHCYFFLILLFVENFINTE